MILWQRFEGGVIFFATSIALWQIGLPLPLWAAALLFFTPDLSFAAYGAGPRVGAVVYNLLHLYAFGALVALIGWLTAAPVALCLGLLWIAHAGFDRVLGYGLKSSEGFGVTHLGRIGRKPA
ncbi:DUF4260 domain-containing protein [Celeribacter neptunius]|uniref:DUF4260 domain-containing protein n=1 Tax=Celeribacter neptunius TaxID=588602 RepID=A0A1I3TRZ2_9RHOB|nr:DUF4260 domain-containing protein [Celeribacter neptunius]SFJ73372.1 protein of unknown function [Celeribacter neptunius]